MSDDGKVAAVRDEQDIILTVNGTWFSGLATFVKSVDGAIQAFCAIVRWRRIAKGYTRRKVGSGTTTRQGLDAFIRSSLETFAQRTASAQEARAVLIAEGIITADGELAAEYRPGGDSGKLQN
jgi:hypothetical protein